MEISLTRPPSPTPSTINPLIQKKAKDFEAMILSQLLSPMFDMISTEGVMGGGHAEETMKSFYVDAISRSMADHQSLGIAKSVETSLLLSLQEHVK